LTAKEVGTVTVFEAFSLMFQAGIFLISLLMLIFVMNNGKK